MKTILMVIGIVIVVISILFTCLSWGVLMRNRQLFNQAYKIPNFNYKKAYGNPKAGLIFSLVGITVGVLLIVTNRG